MRRKIQRELDAQAGPGALLARRAGNPTPFIFCPAFRRLVERGHANSLLYANEDQRSRGLRQPVRCFSAGPCGLQFFANMAAFAIIAAAAAHPGGKRPRGWRRGHCQKILAVEAGCENHRAACVGWRNSGPKIDLAGAQGRPLILPLIPKLWTAGMKLLQSGPAGRRTPLRPCAFCAQPMCRQALGSPYSDSCLMP